ncbi:MAG: hypothetical protein M3506_10885, partial [Chloroflexota bacterium]|nr:hypothetical protein [Chloroflexota bacterium]
MSKAVPMDIAAIASVREVVQASASAIARRLPHGSVRIWVADTQNALQLAASAGDERWLRGEGEVPFADYPIIYASSGFERMTGYASTEIIG